EQEALGMCLHQFLAAFPTDYTEKRVIAAEKRGITMVVELAPWDAMKWKEDFPNTELFWLWAPPKMVAARHKEHGNIRTTNGRARLTEALLSIYRPPEELYSHNPHFLISRKEEDWYLNACYIYKTLFPSV
ncbi:MAG: hypothetical protein M1324_02325, partial [Patescibacteria group bacterium]|nr:hypothetical protein [Patescibacteria group bacterium]